MSIRPIRRFLAWFLVPVGLCALISCGAPTSSVPSAPTSAPASSNAASHAMMHGDKNLININTAILSELDKLEAKLGVPALSNKIQSSRPYGKVEELVSKNVITQAQFDQVKEMVTIKDIVLTGEAKDVDYMTKLGLMKGHLLVAKELLDLNKPDQAEPHIGHPVEEIYADVEDQLQERNVKEFKTALIGLQDLVKSGAKDATKVDSEFNASMKAVEGAIAGLPDTQRQSPAFVVQVINGLLDTANSEYGAAIDQGKVAQPIEYQDSRGFVAYANQLFKDIAPQVEKQEPATYKTMTTKLAELTPVWPTPIPPTAAVKTPAQVSELIKAIEVDSKVLLKS
jgi:Helix-hairpin-helix motif